MRSLLVLVALFILFNDNICGQCVVDRHNTSLESGWISCSSSPNPNVFRGNSHWIMFDMTFEYGLDQLHIWNYNHADNLNRGGRNIVIDISIDGENWEQAGTSTIPMASGISLYSGADIIDLSGKRARFVIITMLNNWGGDCYALSEVRIGVKDEINCPTNIQLTQDLSSKKYFASQNITVGSTILESQTVHFQAGQGITLSPGFSVGRMAELEADLSPCNN